MKYGLLFFLLIIFTAVSFSAEHSWFFPGDKQVISIDQNKSVRNIEIKANDMGGDSIISLIINGITISSKKVRNIGGISWDINKKIKNASFVVKNDIARIREINVHYNGDIQKKSSKELAKTFTLPFYNDLDKEFSLDKELGDTHFLFLFFSSSCRNCAAEMPRFSAIAPKYPNVKFIGIHYKGLPEQVGGFVNQYGIQFDCLYDKDGIAFKLYNIKYIPYALLIDRNGEIVAQGNLKLEEVEKLMDDLSKKDLKFIGK